MKRVVLFLTKRGILGGRPPRDFLHLFLLAFSECIKISCVLLERCLLSFTMLYEHLKREIHLTLTGNTAQNIIDHRFLVSPLSLNLPSWHCVQQVPFPSMKDMAILLPTLLRDPREENGERREKERKRDE